MTYPRNNIKYINPKSIFNCYWKLYSTCSYKTFSWYKFPVINESKSLSAQKMLLCVRLIYSSWISLFIYSKQKWIFNNSVIITAPLPKKKKIIIISNPENGMPDLAFDFKFNNTHTYTKLLLERFFFSNDLW